MTTEQIIANIGTFIAAIGFVWKLIKGLDKSITKRIQLDTAFMAQQLKAIKDQQKFLSECQDDIKRALSEMKVSDSTTRLSISMLEKEVKAAIQKNESIILDLNKSQMEWLTDKLIKIKGEKP